MATKFEKLVDHYEESLRSIAQRNGRPLEHDTVRAVTIGYLQSINIDNNMTRSPEKVERTKAVLFAMERLMKR